MNETIRLEEYCDECDETINVECGADEFWGFKTGRVACPKCGHVSKPCNECFGTEYHGNCGECPWVGAEILHPKGEGGGVTVGGAKFAGPSKRMRDALEKAGLHIDWPTKIGGDGENMCIEGLFYTGEDDNMKIVAIDLRNKAGLDDERCVDAAVSEELSDAYEDFDVGEQMALYLNAGRHGLDGVPDAPELLRDIQEQWERLRQFSEIVKAVADGKPIPEEKGKPINDTLVGESFYVVKDAWSGLYWQTLGGYHYDALDRNCGDVMKADRYGNAEAAWAEVDKMRLVDQLGKDASDPGEVVLVEVETTTRLYEIGRPCED